MLYLLDTNAFSDLMREYPKVDARLAGISQADRVLMCSIVRGEILYDIGRLDPGRKQQDLEAKAAKLFAAIPCEAVPEAASDHYAKVKHTRQQQGLSLDENDLWIAATALALGAVLASRDRDLQNIDELRVEDWTA